MDTIEHTELGNSLRPDNRENNPYLRIDEQGVMHLRLQRVGEDNLPVPMNLELSAGEIVAMAADYYTDGKWTMDLDLPNCERFDTPLELGRYLIRQKIKAKEEAALIKAYNNLAAPDVTREQIDRIYTITNANYIPFSSTLNFYTQQIMFYMRVKDYGEMLNRNLAHFTPWSVRAYILGHHIALRYARLSYELKQLAKNSQYLSKNPDFRNVQDALILKNEPLSQTTLMDLAHRYHAQAYSMELFAFHYYTDHFATGHMSIIGDLRNVLQERFGTWGGILANSLHDEVNRIGVYSIKPYDPTPDPDGAAIRARGDGKFDSCLNAFNKKACLKGMTGSMADIDNVLYGAKIPKQRNYGGLEHMPDVDFNSRQHKPLIVLSNDKVYYRQALGDIDIISPTEYENLRADPSSYGYKELTSKWQAFKLVVKLRLFPYIYEGQLRIPSEERLAEIMLDEKLRSPTRQPIPAPTCTPESKPTVLDWGSKLAQAPRLRKDKISLDTLDGLKKNGVLRFKRVSKQPEIKEIREETNLRP